MLLKIVTVVVIYHICCVILSLKFVISCYLSFLIICHISSEVNIIVVLSIIIHHISSVFVCSFILSHHLASLYIYTLQIAHSEYYISFAKVYCLSYIHQSWSFILSSIYFIKLEKIVIHEKYLSLVNVIHLLCQSINVHQ